MSEQEPREGACTFSVRSQRKEENRLLPAGTPQPPCNSIKCRQATTNSPPTSATMHRKRYIRRTKTRAKSNTRGKAHPRFDPVAGEGSPPRPNDSSPHNTTPVQHEGHTPCWRMGLSGGALALHSQALIAMEPKFLT